MEEIYLKTRELCRLMQNEECFKKFIEAKLANDNDEALQTDIGEFNLIRLSLDNELNKEEKDQEKIKSINEDMRKIYSKIMENESMLKYQESKKELDTLVNNIYSMILACAGGADPDTVEISEGCSGNCSSCGGCH